MSVDRPILSIVTATYNAAHVLPALIESLRTQTDRDFEWVVADGGSTDGTQELLESIKDLRLVYHSSPDFGIYDALNRAIKNTSSSHYLVMGGDDTLVSDAVALYKKSILDSDADLVTAGVLINGSPVYRTARPWVWLYGSRALISSHSVGVCIRKSLHEKNGFYSPRFPIYADGYFLLKAIKGGAKIFSSNFVAGEFYADGCSNNNQLSSFSEQLQAQVLTGANVILQLMLFNLRILKWLPRLR